ncbi:ABC transporter ATP-binding protein [Salicibibacter kimchii]|uniref:ABC transporter ATP-binding protein n=1 Tax=Salicibibacter kimchii TaxID=2099786 RepID=A0A345C1U4_9BACI|nr:ABC transporter ATP-binding protein [Salicibibacter kimchii]AXF57175.1 ABC transporter ATP-binding protein [Salicibibacter kimchii]
MSETNVSTLVELDQIEKSFTKSGKVLDDISLKINQGDFVSILGESGCGKSTLLNMIGGFQSPSNGRLLIGGKPVKKPGRQAIMLFQHYNLLPWRTVQKNVELGIENEDLSAEERRDRALAYIKLVGLEKSKEQFPTQLSGGMQQRVAIARALAIKPEIILMDEPFAALDTFNRYHLQDELLRIHEQEQSTIVLVTHDIDEAVYLSDRVIILDSNPGRIKRSVNVEMPKPRDRSHGDFQYFRKTIFDAFQFGQSENQLDYHI